MREFIRTILQRFGYDIIKTGLPYVPRTKKDVTVQVGNYKLLMPGYNVQAVNYQLYPDLNAQYGRLANIVASHYPGMTLIDAGANVGDTVAVVKTEADIPVIAIEGDEISYRYLEKNSQQFSNVSLIKTFLGDRSQELKTNIESSGWNATIIPATDGEKRVVLKTLDEVIIGGGFNDREIKLLKVDVEGFDTIVLRGARQMIANHQPVLFFEYNRQNMLAIKEEGLLTLLSFCDLGYNKIAFFDHKGTLMLATSIKNTEVVTYLHEYASSQKNLIGYYDICMFHENDDRLAEEYLSIEKKFV
jgi:FkbM family methyltransferase